MKKIHRESELEDRKKTQDFLVLLTLIHGNPQEVQEELQGRIREGENASKPWWDQEADLNTLRRLKGEMKKARIARGGVK